jgi:hypothetical protein
MEPTNIIKAEGKCKALDIKENCNCNVEGFQNNNKSENMIMNLVNKLPISIDNLRAILWAIVAVVFLYVVYSFWIKK